jgi:hypothetical protein
MDVEEVYGLGVGVATSEEWTGVDSDKQARHKSLFCESSYLEMWMLGSLLYFLTVKLAVLRM